MLILFDIDGTLLITKGQGMRAMEDAGCELFGKAFTVDGAQFSGCLDPLIWRQLCEINGVEHTDEMHETFRTRYRAHLTRRFDEGAPSITLPGVTELIGELQANDEVTIGLVTGNYPDTGQLKIERAGIDFSTFTVFGWGIDGGHRRELPPVAIAQHEQNTGETIERERVVVIGDTPHDIDCARFNGCRSLAVATGAFTRDSLAADGADLAVESLADTRAMLDWIMAAPAAP